MIGVIDSIYLGVTEKVSAKGNSYRVVSFMDEGEPVKAMLVNDYSGKLPNVLSECKIKLKIELGQYQRVTVLGFE